MIRSMLRLAPLLAALLAAGCDQRTQEIDSLRQQLRQAQDELERTETHRQELQAIAQDQQQQIQTLQNLGPSRLEQLYTVKALRITRHSGGVDLDGQAGDDAVKVYLQPIDQDGSVIKAAGQVRIQLFDLSNPQAPLLEDRTFPVEELGKHWHSGFMAYHYSFELPLAGQLGSPSVTLRVEFVEHLTGKRFFAQQELKVNPTTQINDG